MMPFEFEIWEKIFQRYFPPVDYYKFSSKFHKKKIKCFSLKIALDRRKKTKRMRRLLVVAINTKILQFFIKLIIF
jgi:hypothetical protein